MEDGCTGPKRWRGAIPRWLRLGICALVSGTVRRSILPEADPGLQILSLAVSRDNELLAVAGCHLEKPGICEFWKALSAQRE